MEEYQKYQHVERLGTPATHGILDGKCYIFPKLDGANGKVWYDNGEVKVGSRNRELDGSHNGDNQGFYKYIKENSNIIAFFKEYPNMVLFGEWLVPHTIKGYIDHAWRKFYVFDVMENGKYLTYSQYQPMMEKHGINYIWVIGVVTNPDYEKIEYFVKNNFFLMKESEGIGEGIVIKNYDFVNKWGRVNWAKVIAGEFKEEKAQKYGKVTEKPVVEQQIVDKYITRSLIEKELAKFPEEEDRGKQIKKMFGVIFHCLVTEETWNFIKEFNNPTVDFKLLNNRTIMKIKELMPELF